MGSTAVGGVSSTVPVAQIPPTSIEAVGYVREGLSLPKGYLDPADLPDSLALLPPPPQPGSAAFAADQAAFGKTYYRYASFLSEYLSHVYTDEVGRGRPKRC